MQDLWKNEVTKYKCSLAYIRSLLQFFGWIFVTFLAIILWQPLTCVYKMWTDGKYFINYTGRVLNLIFEYSIIRIIRAKIIRICKWIATSWYSNILLIITICLNICPRNVDTFYVRLSPYVDSFYVRLSPYQKWCRQFQCPSVSL